MALNIRSNLLMASMGVAITLTLLWQPVSSHGRLTNPPARSTMWRYGYDTPIDYQDNELFCGGFSHQVSQGYKCGICGDPWDVEPRPHEAGGVYATGTIAATYTQGQEVVIEVQLTANHKGWFEFKLCPTNNYLVKATQDCLDLYPLDLSDGSGTKLYVEELGSTFISIPVLLPSTLSCDFCVLQWHYHTGNSWGTDPDGSSCVGCGYQEEFYGCADVVITSTGSPQTTLTPDPTTTPTPAPATESSSPDPTITTPTIRPTTDVPTTTTPSTTPTPTPVTESSSPDTAITTPVNPTTSDIIHTTTPTTDVPTTTTTTAATTTTTTTTTRDTSDNNSSGVPHVLTCRALLFIPGLQEWCDTNCNLDYCPGSHCACMSVPEPRALDDALPAGCYASTPFVNWPGIEDWCDVNCPSRICHDNRCFCKH